MRKLKLQMEDLEVVSFETHRPLDIRGTVDGHKTAPPTEDPTCVGQPSCDPNVATCNGGNTCYQSCNICGSVNTTCAICLLD